VSGRNISNKIIEGSLRSFEPIIGYKCPIIASGTTPIGSAGRAPVEKVIKRKIFFVG
jgi:hypothetical protein